MYKYVAKVDISKFFDSIIWENLEKKIRAKIIEEDVIQLIKENASTSYLSEYGEIVDKYLGIHQGSIISPILSNIYLKDFDSRVIDDDIYYLRYADDIQELGIERLYRVFRV